MQLETYIRIQWFFHRHVWFARFFRALNGLITLAIYLLYPCLIAWLALKATGHIETVFTANADLLLARAVLVPGISFVLVSILRAALNWERPCDKFGIQPVLRKKTQGKSFPSRHIFSIFVIGMTFIFTFPIVKVGGCILIAGVFLGALRIIGGVHYARDVVAGAALGVLAALIGFNI